MIFYRTLTFAFIFIFVSPIVQANNPSPETPALEQLLPQHCHFSGSFSQTRTVENIPTPLESNGNFLFSCDHGLIWHTESPARETLIYTNDKQHFHVDNDMQVKPLKGRLHSHMARLLNALMGADVDYMEEYFSIAHAEPGEAELQPKKKNMQRFIQQLNLHKDKESVEINLVNDARNNTRIHISDTQSINSFDEANCRELFPEPAGVCESFLQVGK